MEKSLHSHRLLYFGETVNKQVKYHIPVSEGFECDAENEWKGRDGGL